MAAKIVFKVETLDGTEYDTRVRPKTTDGFVVLKNANQPSGGYHGPDFRCLKIPLRQVKRIVEEKDGEDDEE